MIWTDRNLEYNTWIGFLNTDLDSKLKLEFYNRIWANRNLEHKSKEECAGPWLARGKKTITRKLDSNWDWFKLRPTLVHPILISGSLVEKIPSIGYKIKKELRGSTYLICSIKSPFFIADWIVALKKIF